MEKSARTDKHTDRQTSYPAGKLIYRPPCKVTETRTRPRRVQINKDYCKAIYLFPYCLFSPYEEFGSSIWLILFAISYIVSFMASIFSGAQISIAPTKNETVGFVWIILGYSQLFQEMPNNVEKTNCILRRQKHVEQRSHDTVIEASLQQNSTPSALIPMPLVAPGKKSQFLGTLNVKPYSNFIYF
jgi:hypothetical protein